ncbi:hypothetical protein GTQ40_07745 [Flavobacteriaceae bacterium R38]|nr:hypothetical protein [Flavobacteriaceae bacterium R38]
MKKLILSFIIAAMIISCSSGKKSQQALNYGNYDAAINIALKRLGNNKTRKGNQIFITQLEEGYKKVIDRDLAKVDFLKKDNNPANLETIYKIYEDLNYRQERIKPLLPLYINEEGRNASFKFTDYTDDLIDSKNKLSVYLYDNASSLLANSKNKYDYRKAYNDFNYLNEINSGYKDVNDKIEEAHFKGTDFVKVALYNDSQVIIPERLEKEMLNFNTYGINDLWTVYHSNPQDKTNYDYEMELAFQEINISPEQIKEREIIKEKRIKDGWKYLYKDGVAVKDSLGNRIKVDKFKKVHCTLYEFTQFKAVQVTGNVIYKDLKSNQVLNSYPISSEFIFEHQYADIDGDKRALDDVYLPLLNVREVAFPSNEQMVYDAGEDLKQRLKSIIKRHKFN